MLKLPFDRRGEGRTRKKSAETAGFSANRLLQARQVVEHAPEFVDLVIDGTMGLDAALTEATRRKQVGMVEEIRADALRGQTPSQPQR